MSSYRFEIGITNVLVVRRHVHGSELTKVLVESERLRNVHLIHDNFVGTVGKAPIVVFVLSKRGPCVPDIFFGQEIDLGDRPFKEVSSASQPRPARFPDGKLDRYQLGCLALIWLKNETKADSERDLRDLISTADADAAEKARRERLLHHLDINTHCRVKIQFF